MFRCNPSTENHPGSKRLATTGVELSRAPQVRLAWMDFYRGNQNVALTCRHFGISRQTFYRWLKRYEPLDLTGLEERSHAYLLDEYKVWTVGQIGGTIAEAHAVPAFPSPLNRRYLMVRNARISISHLRSLMCLVGISLAVLTLAASAPAQWSASAAQWNEEVLYSFQGYPDGAAPVGGMVFDQKGNLYGATEQGGSASCLGPDGCGTVFELSPPIQNGDPWTETVLYVFKGRAYGDGAAPEGGLIMDASGNLYGTTGYDGTGNCTLLGSVVGCGTVYELSPPSQPGGPWIETLLYNFQGGNDGYVPDGDLVFDKAGNLYGATLFGGGKGTNCDSLYGGNCGTIFELSPPKEKSGAWTEKVLHSFASAEPWGTVADAAEPNGGLILDQEGNIYGTTYFGGYTLGHCNEGVGGTGCGTVFELTPPDGNSEMWTETILYAFLGDPDGAGPRASVVPDQNGNLYGTTYGGGDTAQGTAFQLIRPHESNGAWTENVLYRWLGPPQGSGPSGPLLLDPRDGSIYATASAGGTSKGGTLSRLQDPSGKGWVDTVLYNFAGGSTGAGYPDSKLTLHSGALFSNSLYGGTGSLQNCGYGGCGTVYKVWP